MAAFLVIGICFYSFVLTGEAVVSTMGTAGSGNRGLSRSSENPGCDRAIGRHACISFRHRGTFRAAFARKLECHPATRTRGGISAFQNNARAVIEDEPLAKKSLLDRP